MEDLVSAIYGSSQPFLYRFQISRKVSVNNDTVHSPINGHSDRQTALISERFYFPWRNPGQTLIKDFLQSRQVISGHSV